MGNALAKTSHGAFKLTFGTLVVLAAIGATYAATDVSTLTEEMWTVLALGVIVSGVLMLAALLLVRSRSAANVTLAAITLGGVFTAYLVHTELFAPDNRLLMVGLCGVALFGLFVAFRIIDDLRWGGPALAGAAGIAVVVAMWPLVASYWPAMLVGIRTPGGLLALDSPAMWLGFVVVCVVSGGVLRALWMLSRPVDVAFWSGVGLLAIVVAVLVAGVFFALSRSLAWRASAHYADGWQEHPKVQAITFQQTPNVYFVGFDSLVPRSIARKYMGIETTEFHEEFNRKARRFRNLFTNSVSTTNAVNTLMALDLEIYLGHSEKGPPRYFSGGSLSPLVWIMRENGYETTTIYDNTFFGRSKGPYIDNYIINRKSWGLCALLDEEVMRWAFWGYCLIQGASWGKDEGVAKKEDFLLREIANVGRDRPQFVIAHIYMPGHTPNIFDYGKDDAEKFIENYQRELDKAVGVLRQLVDHLTVNDPDSILFIFGDHGAFLSRGVKLDDDPEFFLLDHFAILGGVFPPERCAPYFDDAEGKGYMTTLDAVHAILGCLSGGQTALVEPRRDRFWGGGVPSEHEYHFEEFVYE